MSDTADLPTDGGNAASEQPDPHAEAVRRLADAMWRTALWPALATVVVGAVVAEVWVGFPGLVGAVVGGAVAFVSALLTVGLMRATSGLPPAAVMAVALGGYVGKLLVLLVVMTLLGGIPGIHVRALAFTMLATILVCAAADVRAFQKAKIPVVVPRTGAR